MALFTDTRELDRQAHTESLNRVQGTDKAGLAVLGYKDDGTRNLWGKINPLIGGGVTNAIAANIAKGTDTGATLKASQGAAWSNTLNKAAFAANIATMGTSSAAVAGISKGLNMVAGNGAGGDMKGLLGDVAGMSKNKESMDALNAGGSEANPNADGSYMEQTVGGVPVESGVVGSEVAGGIEGVVADEAANGIVDKAKGVLGTPGVGDALNSGVGAVMSEFAYEEELKNNVIKDGKKSMDEFNYL